MSSINNLAKFIARQKRVTLSLNNFSMSRTRVTVPTFSVQRRFFTPNIFSMQYEERSNVNTSSEERSPLQNLSTLPKAFVANLSNQVVWHQLKDFVTATAPVACNFCKIIKTPEGKSRGCAILYFANEQDRDTAILQLNGATLDGRELKVTMFEENRPPRQQREQRAPRSPREPREPRPEIDRSKQVFVGNLPFAASQEEVFDLFREFGAVNFKLIKTREGKSKGYGFVEFESADQVSEALALNQTEFQGQIIAVNKSEKKEE